MTNDSISDYDSGSTAMVCFITPTHVIIANCGDSRAILISDNKIVLATKDHKPDDPVELERFESAGVRVYPFKILDPDYLMKTNENKVQIAQVISPEPDVYVHERSVQDEYLVLASDGLWDFFSNNELKELIQEYHHVGYDLNDINEIILQKCNELVSTDLIDWKLIVIITTVLYS